MRPLRLASVLLAIWLVPALAASRTLEDSVTEFDLANGMKFIVVERHVAPVFFGALIFNVGSMNEWDGITGISHLLEHMMFKGTETIGTVSYTKEKRYLEHEDDIAASMAELKRRIGTWRLEIFEDFSRRLMANLNEEEKQRIGGDRIEEIATLLSILETGDDFPPEAEVYPTLLGDENTAYFQHYVEIKRKELELEQVMVEHRDLIIKDELWETYVQNGSRVLNAFTANDMTGYIVYLPGNRLELWMMLESDRMKNAVFREFYSEKGVVAEERRLSENDPDDALEEALYSAAFQASPYRRPVIGWMSDIQAITRQDLMDYHTRFYAPNNAVGVLVGDLDAGRVERMARRYFGRIPPQAPPEPVETVEPEQRGEKRVVIEFPANPQVKIAYHVPVAPHPDSYAIQALMTILGQGRTSRLHTKIYEELELTSRAPSISTEPGERLPNVLVIHAIPRHPHTPEEVEAAIYAEIEALQEEPPSEREIQKIRNIIDANMVRMLGSNLGIAFNVGVNAAIRGNWRAFLEDAEKIKQVTPDDVSDVAGKYLTPHNRTVATLIKAEEETEEAEEDEVDIGALIHWIRTLPEEDQKAIFERMQTMQEDERKAYAKELSKRMASESQ
jgi:predicted Zn-dependent peptidase